ncbi:alpha/beta hydrolase [Halanaerobium hydrogeniformans]|uniref:Esterase n=1 Tax=Halanaerobium hydrogeniformans TaxID=656519 RepID=E4RND7_HALHG|nr:alpha/beta hydrolase-fold protein [Halanaerobium hydrogeniformans]ADQ13605.1 esterase [Halanaerobium hydrogeniformans]
MLIDNREIILIDNFYSHLLDNFRNIRLYLPPSYDNSPNRNYPVLYIHDGQNVFSSEHSYSGQSWQLHKTTDALIKNDLIEEIIIVAIDNMEEERLSEYAHEDGSFKGEAIKGIGDKYQAFVIEELMPFIKENLRVKTAPKNTALMGSSMGGLITFNMGLKRPDIFGKLAVMSPSFWWGDSSPLQKLNLYDFDKLKSRIWLDTGDSEGKFMALSDKEIDKLLAIRANTSVDLFYYLAPDAVHSEEAWASRVHCPLLYFFGNIGEKEKLKLHGRERIGLKGPGFKINPVLYFKTGFKHTILDGTFSSSNKDIVDIDQKGNLLPRKKGRTQIKFKALGFKTSKNIEVIEKLSRDVKVKISLEVANDFQDDIYLAISEPREIKLQKVKKNNYKTELKLNRDEMISFKFSLGSWELIGRDENGEEVGAFSFKATKNKRLKFKIIDFN